MRKLIFSFVFKTQFLRFTLLILYNTFCFTEFDMSETPLFHFLNNSLDKGFRFTNVISTHDSFWSKYSKENTRDWRDLQNGGESSDFFRQQFDKFRNGNPNEIQVYLYICSIQSSIETFLIF